MVDVKQMRGKMVGRVFLGGGQEGQASLYRIEHLDTGQVYVCDYIEIASDGFRTLVEGEDVWFTPSPDREGWATYVVPLRNLSVLRLLGLPEPPERPEEPFLKLWM